MEIDRGAVERSAEARGGPARASGTRLQSSAAIGFSSHSGWAVAVGVRRVEDRFEVLVRERIELVDSRDPDSKQPYHAVEGSPVAAAAARLAKYAATAQQKAAEAVERCLERLEARGFAAVGVGILDSAGRKESSLASILGSHALIHAAEGEHFRAALASGASRAGLAVVRIPARQVELAVLAFTGHRQQTLRDIVGRVGRELGPPWGSDQKSAALAAWVVLSRSHC